MRSILVFIIVTIFISQAYTQKDSVSVTFPQQYIPPPKEYTGSIALSRIVDGDTMLVVYLPAVDITSTMIFKNKREARRYGKLVKNVKKAYPYAKAAGQKLEEYSLVLACVTTDKERKMVLKQAEEDLKAEYGHDLKKLTITQGRILIKLVDRETGNTSYELVEDLRGKFSAFFWQSLARLFGHNLKSEYDPEGEDQQIEEIVQMIESGLL